MPTDSTKEFYDRISIDCRPIDAIDVFTKAGFVIDEKIDMSIWSLSVVAVVAVKQDSAKLA
jgi:hypothetical protein